MDLDQTAQNSLPVGRRSVVGGVVAGTVLGAVGLGTGPARAAAGAERIALPAGLRPEGIASAGPRFFVGSLADGRIVTGDLRTGRQRTLLPGAAGRQLRGLFHDPRSGLVWAVGNVGSVAHVWAVDGTSGAVVTDLVVPGAIFLNDVVVAGGAVWVTDSRVDRLAVVALDAQGRPEGGSATFLPLSGAWPAGDGAAINANGIRTLPDGSIVLNNSRVGGLWQVDPATGVTAAIPVSGGKPITSGDGLETRGPIVYDVRGSGAAEVSVVRVSPVGDGTWKGTWVTALTASSLDVPSTATLAVGSLWAVNARFGVASPATADYWITRLPTRG